MSYSIKHLLHINAAKEKVYEALTTIHGLSNWWTVETSGDPSPGKEIEFRFGDAGRNKMKVITPEQNDMVEWECTEGPPDWIGTRLQFTLETSNDKTRVRFIHDGWKENGDFYAACCFSWGRYLESLRQLCQTGKGEAFGSSGYRK